MMKLILMKASTLMFSVSLILLFVTGVNAQSKEKVEEIKWDSDNAKSEFIKADWQMEKHFKNAYGYVIFPNVGKGAIGIDGATGNGTVYEKEMKISMAKLSQLSFGFQWGGQAYREVIFFESKEAMDRFKENNIELSAQVSAVAVTLGASANYAEGVMVFTMQKGGLMYEASVGGQKLKFNPF